MMEHGKKDFGRKQRVVEHGDKSFAGENSRGNHNVRTNEGSNRSAGKNRGESKGDIHFESQSEKERNHVGALWGQLEKYSTPCKEAWIPSNEGKNREGVLAGPCSKIFS